MIIIIDILIFMLDILYLIKLFKLNISVTLGENQTYWNEKLVQIWKMEQLDWLDWLTE